MTVLLSALAFFLLLTVLILIHELGHFAAARKAGVVVEEFGFGLPPKFKTLFRKNGTDFTVNWIPFGGFVRLKGENALTEKERRSKGSFGSVSYLSRISILVAGVFMNFVLAVLLLTIGFSVGRWVPSYLSFDAMQAAAARGEITLEMGVEIQAVIPKSAAERVGIPAGSILSAVDGVAVTQPSDVAAMQEGKRRVVYTVLTGEEFTEESTHTVVLSDGKAGVELTTHIFELSAPKRNPLEASILALRETKVMTVQTVVGIGNLFLSLASTGKVPEGISGIVGIAQLTHASVQQGFMVYLRLVALLSLSLAILNILPFPALDGGRLIFVFAEMISRKPVNRRFELVTNAIGFTFLLLLIVLITFYDIIRLF